MTGCSLNLTPFADVAGVCDHCGTPLDGRRRRWCSDTCARVEFNAHDWNQARRAAKKRDGYKCVTCGRPDDVDDNYRSILEVNHIVPRVGKGYGMGCWNHLDNLETLCHDCHVKVTKQQAADRRQAHKDREAADLAARTGSITLLDVACCTPAPVRRPVEETAASIAECGGLYEYLAAGIRHQGGHTLTV